MFSPIKIVESCVWPSSAATWVIGTSLHPRDVVHNDCHIEWQQPLSDTITVPTSIMTGLPVNAYNILAHMAYAKFLSLSISDTMNRAPEEQD